MADLAAATYCRLLRATESELMTVPAAEAITLGTYVQVGSAGKAICVNSGEANGDKYYGGIALNAAAASMPVTIALPGAIVDLGNILGGMNWGAPVYVGSTDLVLADGTAGTNHIVGVVWPLLGETTTAGVYGKGLRVGLAG
jgi:hypothetical protein